MIPPLKDRIRSAARALPPITDQSFGQHFDWLGKYNVVLLGDASHGTSEFYQARAEITKHLVKTRGFNVIALEADWPDAEAIDRSIRQRTTSKVTLATEEVPFSRFPKWMWRNREMEDLVHWLRDYNATIPKERRAGFYGLDLYSLGASLHAVIRYLDSVDPKMAKLAHRSMLTDLLQKRLEYSSMMQDGEEFHSAEQSARLVADAERYYRAMYYRDNKSWNLRDTHMFETLQRLMAFKKNAKAVVWAHNSHLGDATYTSMGRRNREINLGQLCRQNFDQDVAIIGCGTHTGTAAAAHEWDEPMVVMNVNPSRSDSYEWLAHGTGLEKFLLNMRRDECDESLREELRKERLERFIGVIYLPETERQSHYSRAMLADQFDAYLWFDITKA